MNEPAAVPSTEQVLEHAWNYFALHAGQRMSLFNFFVAFAGATAAGLSATIQLPTKLGWTGAVLGTLLILISFVFWKLDQRTSFLIKHAERAIAELEKTFPLEAGRLILTEPSHTENARRSWLPNRLWTYGEAFRLVFVATALVGAGGLAWSIARLVRPNC